MVPQLRDFTVLNASTTSTPSFAIPTDSGDPTTTPQEGDLGFAWLVWTVNTGSPLVGLTVSGANAWTVLLAPAQANAIGFALLTRRYGDGTVDESQLQVSFPVGVNLVAQLFWYSGVDRLDTIGPIGVAPKAVSATSTAPSLTASGVSNELGFALFAAAYKGVGQGELTGLDRDSTDASTAYGAPGTVLASWASFPLGTLGPSGDVTAAFNFGSQSHVGLQLGLLAVGGGYGGVPQYGPAVGLAVDGIPLCADAAGFGADLAWNNEVLIGSQAFLRSSVGLAVRTTTLADAWFTPTVRLAVAGARRVPVALRVTMVLRTTGALHGHASAALSPSVTLHAAGAKAVVGQVTLGPQVALAVTGALHAHSTVRFAASVTPVARGELLTGRGIVLGPAVRLFSSHPAVQVVVAPQFGPAVRLHARASAFGVATLAGFGTSVALTVDGVADFTPVGVARFAPAVRLDADGYALPGQPVGITVKPVPLEIDPTWHGTPNQLTWSTG